MPSDWKFNIYVLTIVNNYYESGAVVKLNFHPFSTTRGNKFKLQKLRPTCHYNVRNSYLVPELISGIVYQIMHCSAG